ncbi:type II secretion system protein N [Acinetobacter equi]|uniref:General secretion pathway protein n=1 Tax=Acinetobacter equi TaxID=1324350 RepID=A0A0N9VZ74_9GAMM|nr:type II secretion system protein N [Acinetobacter equi]ALH94559.1 general secretion pathway protein [Acinetobacter equi]
MSALRNKIEQIQFDKFNRITPFILVLCIVYLCWKLASLFWLILAPPQAIQLTPVVLGSKQVPVPNITSFALFSEVNNSADQNLNMTLQGVVVGSNNQLSSAVIKLNEISENYRVGDVIDGTSYQLAEVYWDRVILINNAGGRRELKFMGIENGLYQPLIPDGSSQSHENQAEQRIHQAGKNLQETKDGYLKEMGAGTSNENGYEITQNVSSALKSKLRLQTGDIVLSLNGQSLDGSKTEMELLELAKSSGQVKLEVKRGDQIITIQQDLK